METQTGISWKTNSMMPAGRTQPRFGIFILNHNGSRWLPGLLESLSNDGYANKGIFLIDNASTDNSLSVTRKCFKEVTILRIPENLGYSMAYNIAFDNVKHEEFDWFCCINSDTLVTHGWLDRMAVAAEADERIGIIGPALLDWASDRPNHFMQCRHPTIVPVMNDPNHPPVDCDWVEGSCITIRRRCFEEVGPFDPLFKFYWEDADYCRRARYKGWRVTIVPGSRIRHFGGGSSNNKTSGFDSALKIRNQYIYTLSNPERSFFRNLCGGLRLFITKIRASLPGLGSLQFGYTHVKAVIALLAAAVQVWHKWRRDCASTSTQQFQ